MKTAKALYKAMEKLPVEERLAFAAMLASKPPRSGLSKLTHLTQGEFHALDTAAWEALQELLPKLIDLEFHLASADLLVNSLSPLADERLDHKRKSTAPKDPDTKPITVEICRLKKSHTWNEVYDIMIAKYPGQWENREYMRTSYMRAKKKNPSWVEGV